MRMKSMEKQEKNIEEKTILKEQQENYLEGGLEGNLKDDYDDEEGFVFKLWMIPVFAGLMILAILICIPLWNLTHGDKDVDVAGTDRESVIESVTDKLVETGEWNGEDATVEGSADVEENMAVADAEEEDEKGADAEVSKENVQEPISGDTGMNFQAVSEIVTAKDVTNLRSEPSTENADNVVTQLKNGEVLERSGVNTDTGWSRLILNGETVYAVTQFLTTDLSYKTPVAVANPNRVSTLDGRVIIFVDCDDYITPKEYVNLRTEPSTSESATTERCQVNNGENVHRTGYSPDSGWSRVEYNGEGK